MYCKEPIGEVSKYIVDVYKNKKIPKTLRVKKDILLKCSNDIGRILKEKLVNSEAGVHIQHLGYINVWIDAKKSPIKMSKFGNMPILNTHTQGRNWCLGFSEECVRDSILKGWSFDFAVNSRLIKGINNNFRKGFLYKNLYSVLKANKI